MFTHLGFDESYCTIYKRNTKSLQDDLDGYMLIHLGFDEDIFKK